MNESLIHTAVTIATASRLLLDAYESVGRTPIAYIYRQAAAFIAAVIRIRPLRTTDAFHGKSKDALSINVRCALKTISTALSLSDAQIDDICLCLPKEHHLNSFEFPFLDSFVQSRETNRLTITTLSDLPTYAEYNADYDISWDEVHAIEDIMKLTYAHRTTSALIGTRAHH